jgi:hypothetical protein
MKFKIKNKGKMRRLKRFNKLKGKKRKFNVEMPSPLQMAKNLGNSIVANATNVINGGYLKLTPKEASERMDICLGCKFITGEINKERCKKCGCFLRYKTEYAAEHCPIDKW